MLAELKKARNRSVPLLAISCPDPTSTIRATVETLLTTALPKDDPVLLHWDCVTGLTALPAEIVGPQQQARGWDIIAAMLIGENGKSRSPSITANIPDCLTLLRDKLPPSSAVYMEGLSDFLTPEGSGGNHRFVAQAVFNLRDLFKRDRRTLVMLGDAFSLPPILQQSVVVFDELPPTDEALAAVTTKVFGYLKRTPTPEQAALIAPAVRGLTEFQTEQAVSIALTKDGIDMDALWRLKDRLVEQVDGLSVYHGTETFADIGGQERIKWFLTQVFAGQRPPTLTVWIDEMEKALAGATGDFKESTGTSSDALGVLLTTMENMRWTGILLPGVAGSGKSILAKSLGNTFGRKTLVADLGAMKGMWLGQSEKRVRAAMKMIGAIAGVGGAFFVATVNDLDGIPAPLRRRFSLGIWYTDLPSPEEKAAIWPLQIAAHHLSPEQQQPMPTDTNWTGAEIRNCCDIAERLNCSLQEAAQQVAPVAESAPQTLEKLRTMAHGKFLSTSSPGPWKRSTRPSTPSVPLSLEE
jgi:hypothetical protein